MKQADLRTDRPTKRKERASGGKLALFGRREVTSWQRKTTLLGVVPQRLKPLPEQQYA
jgi:hypothetical protein